MSSIKDILKIEEKSNRIKTFTNKNGSKKWIRKLQQENKQLREIILKNGFELPNLIKDSNVEKTLNHEDIVNSENFNIKIKKKTFDKLCLNSKTEVNRLAKKLLGMNLFLQLFLLIYYFNFYF